MIVPPLILKIHSWHVTMLAFVLQLCRLPFSPRRCTWHAASVPSIRQCIDWHNQPDRWLDGLGQPGCMPTGSSAVILKQHRHSPPLDVPCAARVHGAKEGEPLFSKISIISQREKICILVRTHCLALGLGRHRESVAPDERFVRGSF